MERGRCGPKFKTIAGKNGAGSLWKSLAQFDPRVLTIWKSELDAFEKEKKGRRSGEGCAGVFAGESGAEGLGAFVCEGGGAAGEDACDGGFDAEGGGEVIASVLGERIHCFR